MTRATIYGFLVLFGIPLLALFWLVSIIPPQAWVVLGALVVSLPFLPLVLECLREKKFPWQLLREREENRRLEEKAREEAEKIKKEEDERHYRAYLKRGRKY